MDEGPAGGLPQAPKFLVIVDEDVARTLQKVSLVFRCAGDDGDAGKVFGCPLSLLLFGSTAGRAPGQNDRVQVTDGAKQFPSILANWKMAKDLELLECLPNQFLVVAFQGDVDVFVQNAPSVPFKVRKDAVAIEKNLHMPSLLSGGTVRADGLQYTLYHLCSHSKVGATRLGL
ncbi:MAG: hypothetical protein ACYCOX_03600 [Acidobacteriaceae bacterium]